MTIVSGGKTQIAVNTAAVAQGDSIAAYLADSAGNFLTSTVVSGTRRLDTYDAAVKAEDSLHTSADLGAFVLAVRNDAGTPLAGDGDYIPFTTDATGALRVAASLMGTFNEDDQAVDGSAGIATFAVRQDAAGSAVDTDGDYAWFQQNAMGELRVADKAETAILQQVVVVGTTAVALPTAALANRKNLMVQMMSSGQLYIGSSTVTNTGATRGPVLGQGGFVTLDVGPTVSVFGIANAAAKDVAVLEMS